MKHLLPLLLALPIPAIADAQQPPPVETCGAIDGALPAALGAWRAPSPSSGAVRPGAALQIALRPIAELQTAIPPHPARDGGATRGARLDLEIASAGTYQILLSEGAWIDLVQAGTPLRFAAHGHGPGCSTIRKTVDYTLTPGHYVLQLSGTNAAAARLLVIPR